MNQVSIIKHLGGNLAKCELFGTPEQYKEEAAQIRKKYGKCILTAIRKEADILVGSYQVNIARVHLLPYELIIRRNRAYREYLDTLGKTPKPYSYEY